MFAPPLDDEYEDWNGDDFGPGWPAKDDEPKPIALFDTDPVRTLAGVFDRETGEPLKPGQLKPYAR